MTDPMTTHLTRRGARYSIRRRIPSDLISFYGKREIQRALGTSDRREAERLVRAAGAALDAEFEAARATLKARASAVTAHAPFDPHPTRQELEYEEESRDMQIAEHYAEEEADEKAERLIHALRRAGRDLPLYQPDETAPAAIGHAEGLSPQAWAAMEGLSPKGSKTQSLDSLVKKWASERKPDKRTIAIMRRVVRVFGELVGTIAPARIEPRHVVAFKDAMLKAKQTPANTNAYLNNLSTLLNYAAVNLLGVDPVPWTHQALCSRSCDVSPETGQFKTAGWPPTTRPRYGHRKTWPRQQAYFSTSQFGIPRIRPPFGTKTTKQHGWTASRRCEEIPASLTRHTDTGQ